MIEFKETQGSPIITAMASTDTGRRLTYGKGFTRKLALADLLRRAKRTGCYDETLPIVKSWLVAEQMEGN